MTHIRIVRFNRVVCPFLRHDATLLYEVWSNYSLFSTSDEGDPCPGLTYGNSGPKIVAENFSRRLVNMVFTDSGH